MENIMDGNSKKQIQTINYFFYFFNDTVGAILLPIQFSWKSLNWDIFNPELYFLTDLVLHVTIDLLYVWAW